MTPSPSPIALVTNVTGYAGPPAVAALVAAGFRVLIHDYGFVDANRLASFTEQYPHVEYVPADSPASLIENVWERAGRLDAIVSNDHFPAPQASLADASLTYLRETFEALVAAPYALLQAAAPKLRTQGGGNIVMITSCRTRSPIAGAAVPDAARAAANALVRSLAAELAIDGIAVNAIAPNFLYSEAYYPRAVFLDDDRGREYVDTLVPARRLGKPEEIGELIAFLATTNAKFLTGAIIDFAGGWPTTPARPS